MTVTPGVLATITVDPPSAALTADEVQLFTAGGSDAKGNAVLISPIWETTGGAIAASGLYSPAPTGTFIVYANASGLSGTATVEVTAGALASLSIFPATLTLTADQTASFTASGADAHGNPVPVDVTWSVDRGTIAPDGLFTPHAAGTWTILAAQAGILSTARVTVTPGALATLQVTPAAASLLVGETQTFTAAGWDAKGNPIPDLQVTWTTQGGVGNLTAAGFFEASAPGPGTVTAQAGGVSAAAAVEVRAPETPAAPPLDLWPVALLLLAVLIGLLVLLLWRRRPGDEAPKALPPPPE